MIRAILQHPDPRLRETSAPIDMADEYGAKLAKLIAEDLVDTIAATGMGIRAIGLAAPQIGHAFRVIVVDVSPHGADRRVMVNPVITKASRDQQRVLDGCMSVDRGRKHISTKRPKRIAVEWQDVDGTPRSQKFANLIAAVIHHEVDHLDGRLFIDPRT